MKREDWVLLVLASADGVPMGTTHVQKSVFLVATASTTEGSRPSFEPGSYGPRSHDVSVDLDRLEERGLVFSLRRERGVVEYAASVAGWKSLVNLPCSDQDREYARAVVTWARRTDFNGLWRSFRSSHPELCLSWT